MTELATMTHDFCHLPSVCLFFVSFVFMLTELTLMFIVSDVKYDSKLPRLVKSFVPIETEIKPPPTGVPGFDSRLRPIICKNTGDFFLTSFDAAKWAGCSRSAISMQLIGKNASCMGYSFRYATTEEIQKALSLTE